MIRFCKLSIFLFCLCGGLAYALPNDSEQPINFQADLFEMDDVRKTQTYSGAVEMEQGSMKISAEKVVIYRKGNRTSRIIATGQPARYSQIAEMGEDPIIAKARRMEYDVEGKTLHLIEDASIVQKGTSLSTGNRIDYDVQKSLVKAEGSKNGDSKGRVRMIIPPEQREE